MNAQVGEPAERSLLCAKEGIVPDQIHSDHLTLERLGKARRGTTDGSAKIGTEEDVAPPS
ncbi:MAG: hypothetical protein QOJ99_2516 [Bryobacterales bacterium]|nr:hypothetical protein [Bryobacterales bacterium]